jgi:transaldolase
MDKRFDIKGFTTNPTLMRKAGIKDVVSFGRKLNEIAGNRSVSYEVVSDDSSSVIQEARKLNSLGDNVSVKVPVVTSLGKSNLDLICSLLNEGISINITAVLSKNQINKVCQAVGKRTDTRQKVILSIFCGRIADTGRDPTRYINLARDLRDIYSADLDILWASVREAYNIKQAELSKADIITVTPDFLFKWKNFNKDLEEFSRETSLMFFNDANESGMKII